MNHVPFEGRNTATSDRPSPSKSPDPGADTTRTNDVLVVNPRALANSVMVVEPLWLDAMVNVRVAPDPPTTMFVFRTIAGLDETAPTVTPAAPPTKSLTVT